MKRQRKQPSAVFLVNDKDGKLYCQDGRFRRRVLFGNVSCCLKTWRKPGFAKRAARKLGLEQWTIKFAYAGDSITPYGTVKKG
jgi:hypothetical protein